MDISGDVRRRYIVNSRKFSQQCQFAKQRFLCLGRHPPTRWHVQRARHALYHHAVKHSIASSRSVVEWYRDIMRHLLTYHNNRTLPTPNFRHTRAIALFQDADSHTKACLQRLCQLTENLVSLRFPYRAVVSAYCSKKS